jgi:hypothetical protein
MATKPWCETNFGIRDLSPDYEDTWLKNQPVFGQWIFGKAQMDFWQGTG